MSNKRQTVIVIVLLIAVFAFVGRRSRDKEHDSRKYLPNPHIEKIDSSSPSWISYQLRKKGTLTDSERHALANAEEALKHQNRKPDTNYLWAAQSAMRDKPATSNTDVIEGDFDYYATAASFNAAYQENEVKADRLYKGKRIRLTGRITTIAKNFWNKPYITLSSGEYLQEIHCEVSEDDAMYLHKGARVSIIGTCNGMMMGSVFLKDCNLDQ